MADTSKTFDELITDFANNTSGAISEQDQRNLVESIFQYGGMRMLISDTPSGQSIGTSFIKLSQFTENALFSNFIAPAASTDTITITKGGVFATLISLNFSGSNNSTWEGSMFKDNTDTNTLQFKHKLSTGGDVGTVSVLDFNVFTDGEAIDYRLKADAAAKTFTLEAGTFFLMRIG